MATLKRIDNTFSTERNSWTRKIPSRDGIPKFISIRPDPYVLPGSQIRTVNDLSLSLSRGSREVPLSGERLERENYIILVL